MASYDEESYDDWTRLRVEEERRYLQAPKAYRVIMAYEYAVMGNAVIEGDVSVVHSLIRHDIWNRTPRHVLEQAVNNGHIDVVRYVVNEWKVDINKGSPNIVEQILMVYNTGDEQYMESREEIVRYLVEDAGINDESLEQCIALLRGRGGFGNSYMLRYLEDQQQRRAFVAFLHCDGSHTFTMHRRFDRNVMKLVWWFLFCDT